MRPVTTHNGYTIGFAALSEDQSARKHFIVDCGYDEARFAEIENFAFFTAHVTLWRSGEFLAETFLGACSYETEAAFLQDPYFTDMITECFATANLRGEIEAFIAAFKQEHAK